LRQHCRAAEHDDEPQAHPLHRLDPPPNQVETRELGQTGGDGNPSGSDQVARDRIDDQKQDCR